MPARTRILIADDHPLFRKGLRETIETNRTFQVVGEASEGREALQRIRDLKPDVCILDINMPGVDGLAVARQMRSSRMATAVIILTMYKEEDLFNAAMDLGVKGYVLKESAVTDILDAVRSVKAGHTYLSPTLADFLIARRAGADALRAKKPGLDQLTPAERRILKLIAEDKTSKEIADELGLSPRTVENHRTNICAKLDVHGVHSLLKFAYDHKSHL
ncbi:MAG: response regulator transcription factor [Verrucomicrobia bacterium]|nr:response regulator transcription factor [Verrucomicrobiota bacterium]